MKNIFKNTLIFSLLLTASTHSFSDYPIAKIKRDADTVVISADTYEGHSFAATHLFYFVINGKGTLADPLAPAGFGAPELEVMPGYCAIVSDADSFTGSKTRYFGEGKYNLTKDYGYEKGIKAFALYWAGAKTKCQTLSDIPVLLNADKTKFYPLIDTSSESLYGVKNTNPYGYLKGFNESFFAKHSTEYYVLLNDSHYQYSNQLNYNLYSYYGGFIHSGYTLSIPKCYEVELSNLKTNTTKKYTAGVYNVKNDFNEVHAAQAHAIKNCIPSRTTGLVLSEYDDLPIFSADYYLATNSDVANAVGRQNFKAAKVHWDTFGKKEGRISAPGFQVKEYLQLNQDLISAFGNNYAAAIDHFKTFGIKEGRQASYSFSVRDYLAHYSDLRNAFGASGFLGAHDHWVRHGLNEGRRSSSTFDVSVYLNKYPDLTTAFGKSNHVEALVHYHQFGRNEGRTSN